MLWTQATVVNNICCHKQRKPIIALSVICRHVSNVWQCSEWRCTAPPNIADMQLTQHDHDEEGGGEPHVGHHQTIARVRQQQGDWTVGGDWSLDCGLRGRLFRGDWRRLRMRGRQDPRLVAAPPPRTLGTYLNLLMAARLSVKIVAFRHTGTIISCVIPSWENCSTKRGKLTAKIIFHNFAQEKNYLRLFEYIFPQVAK